MNNLMDAQASSQERNEKKGNLLKKAQTPLRMRQLAQNELGAVSGGPIIHNTLG